MDVLIALDLLTEKAIQVLHQQQDGFAAGLPVVPKPWNDRIHNLLVVCMKTSAP
jgi:hypothetical protein